MRCWSALIVVALAVLNSFALPAAMATAQEVPPTPIPSAPVPATTTPVSNVVFLMQENHSFDNYFGTRPGVDGIPDGTCMPRVPGSREPCVRPYHIGGKAIRDLEHTEAAFQDQFRGGQLDGFVWAHDRKGGDGALAMGYYDDRDLPYYWNVADEYVLFDRFFTSARGGSVRNHMYAVTGQPGATGASEAVPAEGWGDIPTIFDRLEEKGISWKFYIQNYDPSITFKTRLTEDVETDRGAQVIWAPLLAYARYVDDPRLFAKIAPLEQYYEDAARGELPAVSFIRPSGNSEHPPGSVQAGQRLVRALINELMRSPQWKSSAFIWSYDDWGGWYDHVNPPAVDEYGYGPRAPALLVSPYARRGFVDHEVHDFTSILRFIQVNWSLAPLAERDSRAGPMLEAFDFNAPPREPVLLSLERQPPPSHRIQGVYVYAGYALAVVFVGALLLLPGALQWWRRRTHDTAGEPDAREPAEARS